MPNHIHGIIIITDTDGRGEAFSVTRPRHNLMGEENASPLRSMNQMPHGTCSGSLGAIMQNFKSVSTRKINQSNNTPGAMLWQRNYYEHIVRNENSLNTIRRYIAYNPVIWAYDMDNPDKHHVSEAELKYEIKTRCNFTDDELDLIINYDIKYRTGHNNGGKKQ